MKLLGKTMYGFIGVLLAGAVLFTGQHGLSKQDKAAYQTALELQTIVDDMGFANLTLSDYTVAFFDGGKEYVLYKGEVSTRKPILGNLVATTWKVEGQYEVLIPTLKDMETAMGLATGLESKVRAYGLEEHSATIWHEAFHAWQMTWYEEDLEQLLKPGAFEGQAPEENEWAPIDVNPGVKLQMEGEMALLAQAYNTKDSTQRKQLLTQYFALKEKRIENLPEYIETLENFYELSEGGASYVESEIYLELLGKEMYNEKYLLPAGSFAGGTVKYYRTGLLKYLLMDELEPDWKASFNSSKTMDMLLKEALEKDE